MHYVIHFPNAADILSQRETTQHILFYIIEQALWGEDPEYIKALAEDQCNMVCDDIHKAALLAKKVPSLVESVLRAIPEGDVRIRSIDMDLIVELWHDDGYYVDVIDPDHIMVHYNDAE